MPTQGWEFVHVAIDDCTRLAYIEVLPDEKAITAVGFLRRALAFYRRYGITVERLITDNGSRLPLHRRTPSPAAHSASATSAPAPTDRKPTARPSDCIRTMLGGWAYGALYAQLRTRAA